MEQSSEQLIEIYQYLEKSNCFAGDAEQSKLIDQFILKNRDNAKLPRESVRSLMTLIQNIQQGGTGVHGSQVSSTVGCQFHLKPLQLLRLLSKPKDCRQYLKPQFLAYINQHMPEAMTTPLILIEILALHLRFIEDNHTAVTHEMFGRIIDLLAMNNLQVTLVILEITRDMTARGVNKIFDEVWYVGRLIYAMQRLEASHKPKLVNLIKDLLVVRQFNENFRRINGVTTLINELKRSQPNFMLKISLLSCLQILLLTTKTEVIYDFKLNNFLSLINLKMREPLDYKEITFTIKILTHLMLDNDMSTKYVEDGLEDAIALLVRSHPTNCHMIKFDDIDENCQREAFEEFRTLLLRLLRYVCSLQKNRKIFKRIFPSELLGPFIDVGHFVKSKHAYAAILAVFNKLDNAQVLNIEDEYQRIGKMMKNKNFKLEVVGNYNLLQELGQGAFGCVYLAKKGSNEYALKRIKVAEAKKGGDKAGLDQYFREVDIYKELKHPNIIRFYESFIEDEHLYIVMEVVKGSNLSELIKNQNQKGAYFEEDLIWRLLISLLSVLRYLHLEKKIIHRDLNPSNIMVDNKFNIKVADFGLAKTITPELHMTHSFVGTLAYSCPQIVQNEGYNEKADIWSLGCIIFELMSLKTPFAGSNLLYIAKNIVSGDPLDFPQHYSQELQSFVNLCLTRDQAERPDVRQLLKAVAERVIIYTDELREKQIALSDEIVSMNKKINLNGGFGATHTRVFGNSHYGTSSKLVTGDDVLCQTQIVKIDSDILSKIGEDPMSKFIDVVKKLSLIASTQSSLRKNFKKYVVDTFYNRVIISDEFRGNQVKNELQKLINLSKEDVSFLGVKFELKQNYIKSITYEMLYFYIDELFELIKKV